MRKIKTILFIVLAGVAVFALALMLYAKLTLTPEKVRQTIAAEVSHYLRRDISFKEIQVGWLGGVLLKGVILQKSFPWEEDDILACPELRIQVRLITLLLGKLFIKEVVFQEPHIACGYRYQPGGVRSPDGHCRAFDAQAGGTVFGSGMGVVLLRRLEEALEEGDWIHAIIRGSAINNDGSLKVSFGGPSVVGQSRAVAEALAVAGVAPENIGYIETHGTATDVGDTVEIAALTRAFGGGTARRRKCLIGSVKTNVGHLEAAAGVTGLIKAARVVETGLIPPSLTPRPCGRWSPGSVRPCRARGSA